MSGKAIRSIILFMSVSLAGLIAFQAYWISHSIKKEAQNFDRDIQQLISSVSASILKQEARLFIKSSVSSTDLEESGSDIQIIIKGDKDEKEKEDRVIIVNSENGRTVVTTNSTTVSTSSSTTVSGDMIKKYRNKKNMLTEVVDEIAYEYVSDDLSLSERLKNISIDSLIGVAFVNSGFENVLYSFYIKDTDEDSVIRKGGQLSDLPKNNTSFVSELSDSGKLVLGVENKTLFILRSLWLSLLLSFILTVILLGTFIYTITSILRQKRIATMKADFINNMTHEFKTPVATISLAIDSILHKEVRNKPNEIEKYGEIIKKENKRMNNQIESLLEIAMFDKESFELNQEIIDIHELIQELKENFEIKTSHQFGDIGLFLNAGLYHIKADKMHFYNSLRNIVDNAIKFSPQDFRIKISTENKADTIIIKIADRGIGMNAETQQRMFDRFYRKTEGNLHNTKGFGLGLAYVKEVLTKMNMNIFVQSELKKGTVFTIKAKGLK